jgi:hypothetical protein
MACLTALVGALAPAAAQTWPIRFVTLVAPQ